MSKTNPSANEIYTVSRLNRTVRTILEDVLPIIWVQAELSNLSKPTSGHLYFTLKDNNAQVRCAMFKNRQSGMRFEPKDGMQVLARAKISVYEARGEYQLIIESLKPAGTGVLQMTFENLKQKLATAGLFDAQHKKPLPPFPATIGIITSTTGAAIHDILSILKRRYPSVQILIYPSPVQGHGAAEKIARMIAIADQRQECDVLLLSRGGGSLEDLWAFNEECVAWAIFNCKTPLICGVGHEIDFSIADFVADARAPTPSAAAELASPDTTKVLLQLARYAQQLFHCLQQYIKQQRQRLALLLQRLTHPKQQLQQYTQRLDEYALRFNHHIEKRLTQHKILLSTLAGKINQQQPSHQIQHHQQRLTHQQSQLQHAIRATLIKAQRRLSTANHILTTVGPQATLARGYAIITDKQTGALIRNADPLTVGDALHIQLAQDKIDAKIEQIYKK